MKRNFFLLSLRFRSFVVHPAEEYEAFGDISATSRMVMKSFRCDCREAYVISNSYGMGGITRTQLFEMTRPGDSESKKRFHHHSTRENSDSSAG